MPQRAHRTDGHGHPQQHVLQPAQLAVVARGGQPELVAAGAHPTQPFAQLQVVHDPVDLVQGHRHPAGHPDRGQHRLRLALHRGAEVRPGATAGGQEVTVVAQHAQHVGRGPGHEGDRRGVAAALHPGHRLRDVLQHALEHGSVLGEHQVRQQPPGPLALGGGGQRLSDRRPGGPPRSPRPAGWGSPASRGALCRYPAGWHGSVACRPLGDLGRTGSSARSQFLPGPARRAAVDVASRPRSSRSSPSAARAAVGTRPAVPAGNAVRTRRQLPVRPGDHHRMPSASSSSMASAGRPRRRRRARPGSCRAPPRRPNRRPRWSGVGRVPDRPRPPAPRPAGESRGVCSRPRWPAGSAPGPRPSCGPNPERPAGRRRPRDRSPLRNPPLITPPPAVAVPATVTLRIAMTHGMLHGRRVKCNHYVHERSLWADFRPLDRGPGRDGRENGHSA